MSTAKIESLGTPGAVESNAGDDYHVLWACRKALRLLDIHNDLVMVRVEGVSLSDETAVADPDSFLGVDLTEYYGSESFESASSVVVAQLKYSQRHPDRPWTAARLCEPVRGEKTRCVIARLAQAFQGFCENTQHHLVVERLTVKLVSNRPADIELVKAVDAAQAWLASQPVVQAAKLLKALEQPHQEIIRKLKDACSLQSAAFCSFLRCLDFSDCNSDGRLWQRLRLIQEIGIIAPASPIEHVRDLYERVASEALPKVGVLGLRKADILAVLGCPNETSLFPAPSRFEKPSFVIATPDANRVVQSLQAAPERSLLAHGAGGVGKTTTALSLPEYWDRARWVFYDCFGGGTYKDSPGDERHSPKRALLQLCNELAITCGTPFLVRPPAEVHDLWREFRNRLAGAASILEAQGESLVIVIDAADNATLASVTPEESFVQDLWKIPKPDNVYLLMTARSGGRAQSLGAPIGVSTLELTGFDEGTTAKHLRHHYPSSTDAEAKDFHINSHGNPRVQTYAVGDKQSNLEIVLENAHRKLEDIFQDYVTAGLTLKFKSASASELIDELSCFPRPLRLTNLVEVLGLTSIEVHDLCNALSPGLSKETDGWGFRDEDFDTFLHNRIAQGATQKSAHHRLANKMAALPASPFAALHYADYLFAAGDDETVVQLALQGELAIACQLDEVGRTQLIRRRISLGIRSAVRTQQFESLVELCIQAADAARSDYAILKLIEQHADLAALYADPNVISDHYLNTSNKQWFGGAQLKCAALFSRYDNHQARAKDHWELAQAWLRRWVAKPDDERQRWSVKTSEIAAGTEAAFRLFGPEHAYKWLKSWRPFETVVKASGIVARAIAGDLPPNVQTELYNKLKIHPLIAMVLLTTFSKKRQAPEQSLVESVVRATEAYCHLKTKQNTNNRKASTISRATNEFEIALGFAEILPLYHIEAPKIAFILKQLCEIETSFAPHDGYHAHQFSSYLRVLALVCELDQAEISDEDIRAQLLKHRTPPKKEEQVEEIKRFDAMILPRYRIYRLRAEALMQNPQIDNFKPRLIELLERGEEEKWRYSRNYDYYFRDALLPLSEAALACSGNVGEFFTELGDIIVERLKGGAPAKLLDLAELLLNRKLHTHAAERLFDLVVKYLSENVISGSDHCDILLRAAEIMEPHDNQTGANLFHRAIKVARELNDDLAERIKYLAESAGNIGHQVSELDARDISARLIRLTEQTHNFVTNDDNYPWNESLGAIIKLHQPSSYALFTRWTRLGHIDARSDIIDFTLTSLDSGSLDVRKTLALLRLSWDKPGLSNSFIAILEKSHKAYGAHSTEFKDILRTISSWIARDTRREQRTNTSKNIKEWLAGKNINNSLDAKPLLDYLDFVSNDEVLTFKAKNPSTPSNVDDDYTPAQWDNYIGPSSVPEKLRDLLSGIRKIPGYQAQSVFFEHARRHIRISQRVDYLQALLDLPTATTSGEEYLSEWEECLSIWQHDLNVQSWIQRNATELARQHLPSILGYQYHASERFDRFLALPMVNQVPKRQLLGSALTEWVERLDAWQLYPIASALKHELPFQLQKDLLIKSIAQGEQAIESRVLNPLPSLPDWRLYADDEATPFATLLFTILGDPDTRIRWSCLHTLELLNLQNQPRMLGKLIDMLDATSVGGFVPAGSNFLWISARAYLLMFISRLASLHPGALEPHIEILLRHAINRDFPHVQIREFAKRALLSIEKFRPGIISSQAVKQLHSLNRPKTRLKPEGYQHKISDDRHHQGRFNFNPMDTLPYWYSPLGRKFNLSASQIATMAEFWICDTWGLNGREDCVSELKHPNRDWHLSTNDHGSLPVIEDGQLYYEYHAMLLVAGQLSDSHEQIVESYESDYDSWDRWLSSHLPTRGDVWLSTLRSSVPLESELNCGKPREHYNSKTLTCDDFDYCLGLSAGKCYSLIVAASVQIQDRDGVDRWKVESALVTREAAHSLLRALQSADDPHSYRLPPAGSEHDLEWQGQSLDGWIEDISGETELDGRDPLLYRMNTGISQFPESVCAGLGVKYNSASMQYADQQNGQVVAEARAWCEPYDDTEDAEYSEGWQLRIDLQLLTKYLQGLDRCLILEVQINRKEKTNDEKKKYEYAPPSTLIYLFHPEGKLETLEHHHILGKEDT
ncbi:ATP-binding protein [Pseudomonas parafulva]|uniref:ATP-binding protein n=1 Tax=Pseudomonas parafulva TaxID=157782 RepID=UPI0018D95458|nr:ATP-binding protein [Pseudomonas parafulva]MBH3344162.1 ATP-binding protein [Pseudomonas parafulva]